ncbi:MAG: hypothetical protein KZQ70_11065, partial [gamma proteobacterium symbiont of Lucinoma myriamae]|nr:hypothetical protein [gamma proteobacterium symbiont of Lucinoma myriamae]
LKDKKGSRRIYDKLIGINEQTVSNRWSRELGNISIEDWKKYNDVLNELKEVKLKDFQFKINNKIIATKSFLYKINRVDNDLCYS